MNMEVPFVDSAARNWRSGRAAGWNVVEFAALLVEVPVPLSVVAVSGPHAMEAMRTKLRPHRSVLRSRIIVVHSHDGVRFLEAREKLIKSARSAHGLR